MQSIVKWLYLPEGYTGLIRRLCGLLLLQILPMLLYWLAKAEPYRVTAWRLGDKLFELPAFSFEFDLLLWSAYGLSALFLLFGAKQRIFLVVPALVLLIYSFVERLVVQSGMSVLLFTYCLSLLFYHPGLSLSRRLIQISVSLCYLFSVLHKLHPEFISGQTLLYILNNGVGMREFAAQWMQGQHLTLPLARFLACGALFSELFLAIAPWFKSCRIFAFVVAIVVHGLFSCLWTGIESFAFVMWLGYLAFFDKPNPAVQTASLSLPANSKKEIPWACALIILLLWMPARFFVGGWNDFASMSFGDRWPWSFAMYLFWEKTPSLTVSYLDDQGDWHELPVEGRMKIASSKTDMLKLAQYVLSKHKEAKEIRLQVVLEVNGRYQYKRSCRYYRSANQWLFEFKDVRV
ncbi:MAG: hypothetical protein K2W82_15465 [Candidatus Obscuribacterales bacterium]|nr:hypothetical protein [Candidatus Obscuribacterales bacterium]